MKLLDHDKPPLSFPPRERVREPCDVTATLNKLHHWRRLLSRRSQRLSRYLAAQACCLDARVVKKNVALSLHAIFREVKRAKMANRKVVICICIACKGDILPQAKWSTQAQKVLRYDQKIRKSRVQDTKRSTVTARSKQTKHKQTDRTTRHTLPRHKWLEGADWLTQG